MRTADRKISLNHLQLVAAIKLLFVIRALCLWPQKLQHSLGVRPWWNKKEWKLGNLLAHLASISEIPTWLWTWWLIWCGAPTMEVMHSCPDRFPPFIIYEFEWNAHMASKVRGKRVRVGGDRFHDAVSTNRGWSIIHAADRLGIQADAIGSGFWFSPCRDSFSLVCLDEVILQLWFIGIGFSLCIEYWNLRWGNTRMAFHQWGSCSWQ